MLNVHVWACAEEWIFGVILNTVLLCLFTKQLELLYVPQWFGMVAHAATDIPLTRQIPAQNQIDKTSKTSHCRKQIHWVLKWPRMWRLIYSQQNWKSSWWGNIFSKTPLLSKKTLSGMTWGQVSCKLSKANTIFDLYPCLFIGKIARSVTELWNISSGK